MSVILQTETSECGLACLAMIANHFGYETEIADLRRRFGTSLKGMKLAQLIRYAGALNLASRPLRLQLDELPALRCPAILHWNLDHFVVLKKIRKTWRGTLRIVILDPAVGERNLALSEISRHFTGVAIEFTPTDAFERKQKAQAVSVAELTGRVAGLRRAIIQAIILAMCLEIFAIISPLFNQFVIDEVISSADRQLLNILVLGFGLVLVTQTSIALARSWFLMRWSLDIGTQWTLRLFSHLIRLPVSYFEKRHLGDIASRFGSLGAIQSTLTSLFVESLLDGLMAALALIMMFLYSPLLSCIVLASLSIYGLLRWAFFAPLREATVERLALASKENSAFLETIRAITPLKLYGRESERLARWQNLKQQVVNRDIRTRKLEVLFKSLNTGLGGAQSLATFYTGAELIMSNQLTVGMLSAFASYAATFSSRVFSLIDLYVNVRTMKVHTVRLADIVAEQPEIDVMPSIDTEHISPSISLRNIKFRYGEGEPWILHGINLDIPAGQSVVIVGPSGCGKTTLCKVILGLIPPTEGDVLVGGHLVKQVGAHGYRRMIGTVMQEDVLLAGSIHDNITFFDVRPDDNFAEECARLAAVHDEIVSMPMGYRTLVGDMGSSLSGGQKQRILLARALYKRPRILVLDEATSHLDIFNEKKVSTALGNLAITRILVAHRPETINSAERIIRLQNGVIE